MKLNELLKEEVIWMNHSYNLRFWTYTDIQGRLFLLRENNWHDENAYTVICGEEILELDDKPKTWITER